MRRVGLLAIVFLLGCGLDEEGLEILDSGTDVASDVVKDVQQEPFVCADAGPASCTNAVPFRSPALFSPDAGAACPAGYDTHDLVLSTPQSATCTCQCTDGGAPSCDITDIHYNYGVAVCTTSTMNVPLNGICTATNNTTFTGESIEVDPPKIAGGCGGGTSVPPATSTTNVRLCTPQCASDESVCTPQGGLSACVMVAGNVANCPSNYPSAPFYIGANPQPTCDNCSCSGTGDCTASTAHFYGTNTCGGGDHSFPMDGQCHLVSAGDVGGFLSANVKPSLKNNTYQCNVTEGSVHMTYGGNDFTVCCQ